MADYPSLIAHILQANKIHSGLPSKEIRQQQASSKQYETRDDFLNRCLDHFVDGMRLIEGTVSFKSKSVTLHPAPHEFVRTLIASLFHEANPNLWELRERMLENVLNVSRINREQAEVAPHRIKLPDEGDDIRPYLAGTPFLDWVDEDVECGIPDELRFEHHYILASSGHGKTQTFQNLLAHDLVQVAEGNASVVVIDSQGDLIRTLSRKRMFYDGGLKDKLTLISPRNPEYPLALNPYHINESRMRSYSVATREQILNGTISIFDYLLGAILGAEMTSKQGALFRYITRLLLIIPDATIHTFLDLVTEGGADRYSQYIDTLPDIPKRFFREEFDGREFRHTKDEVRRRIWTLLENTTLTNMFSAPTSKLDMFEEMNAGRVILIDTAKSYLQPHGSQIFGRFFVSLIVRSALERETLQRRMPCYVYIDEFHEVADHNVQMILEQARKYRVALIMAHQETGQLPPPVLRSIQANTSIKMAGGVSANDARTLANEMRTTPQFIDSHPKLSFALSLKGIGVHTFASKPGLLDRLDDMTDAQFEELQSRMREKYAVRVSSNTNTSAQTDTPTNIEPPEADPTKPSTTWGDTV